MAEEKKEKATKEVATEEEVKEITYRTHDNANFTGFMHPKTRRLVTVDKNKEIKVKETDADAIEILGGAKDVFKV